MAEAQVRLNRIFQSLKRSRSPFYGAEKIITRPANKGIVSLYNLTTSALNNLGKNAAQDILNTLGVSGVGRNFKSTSTKSERNFTDRSTRSNTTIVNNNTTTVASTGDKNQRKLLDGIRLGITRNRKILVNINKNMEKLLKLFKRQSVLARLDRDSESKVVKNVLFSQRDVESNRSGFGFRSLFRGGLIAGLAGTLFGIMSSAFKNLFRSVFALANLKNLLRLVRFGGPLALVATLATSLYNGFKSAYNSFMNGESAGKIIDNFSQKFLESITFGFLDKEAYENLKDKISNFASRIGKAIYREEGGNAFLFGQQLPTREELAERVPKIVDNVVNSLANVVSVFISSARDRVSNILGTNNAEVMERAAESRQRPLNENARWARDYARTHGNGTFFTPRTIIDDSDAQKMLIQQRRLEERRTPLRGPYGNNLDRPTPFSATGQFSTRPAENDPNILAALAAKRDELERISTKLLDSHNTILSMNQDGTITPSWIRSPRRERGPLIKNRRPLLNQARELAEEIQNLREKLGSSGVGRVTTIEPRKKGGPVVPSIPYLVGERGREIFVPNQSGTVINNNITERLVGSSSDSQRLSAISGSSKLATAVVYNDNRVTNNTTGGGSQAASSGGGKSNYSPFNSLASRLSTRADRTLAPLGYTARTLA